MTSPHTEIRRGAAGARVARETRLPGVAASPGVAIGCAYVLPQDSLPVPRREIRPAQVAEERARLERALRATRHELLDIQRKLSAVRGGEEARIFDAHLLMLADSDMLARTHDRIEGELLNAEAALFDVLAAILAPMDEIQDPYLRERAADIRDVKRRVLKNLLGQVPPLANLPTNSVVIAHDLTPTLTAELDKDRVLGFATEAGSTTSHTAILARSLEIPAVVALGYVAELIRHGERLVVDGDEGFLIRNPSDATVDHYEHVALGIQRRRARSLRVGELPSVTADGVPFRLEANIEIPREVEVARLYGAAGIGLFRTEFLFMRAGGFPDEEEQLAVYRLIVEGMRGKPVTIRTLDLGGDKMPTDPYAEPEANPFLGWRAVRYSLDHPDIFRHQLRAILRASAWGPVRVMFPLVSALEELGRCRALVHDVWEELAEEGHTLGQPVSLGAMVETPGAALVADALAAESDFLSIGTNDLTQYTLAVDRGNTRVAGLFRPFHPGVLLLIERTVDAARQAGIEVALCGEMAANPRAAVLLLGMGLRSFSMIAARIPDVKSVLRATTVEEAEALWRRCRELRTANAVQDLLEAELGGRLRDTSEADNGSREEDDMRREESVAEEGAVAVDGERVRERGDV